MRVQLLQGLARTVLDQDVDAVIGKVELKDSLFEMRSVLNLSSTLYLMSSVAEDDIPRESHGAEVAAEASGDLVHKRLQSSQPPVRIQIAL